MTPLQQVIELDLRNYLLSIDKIDKERMPDMPDIDAGWEAVAMAYLPDGVPEYQNYPLASLGWMMYVGMAVAQYWDADWERYSKEENLYAPLKDKRGYDCMDEAISEDVLKMGKKEQTEWAKIVMTCAQTANDQLRHAPVEPSTPQAFHAYVDALHALYRIGAAAWLYKLGYRMQKLS